MTSYATARAPSLRKMAAAAAKRVRWSSDAQGELVGAVGRSPQLATLMASTSAPNEEAWVAVLQDMGRAERGRNTNQLRAKWKALKAAFHKERRHRQRHRQPSQRSPLLYGLMRRLWLQAGRPVWRGRLQTAAMRLAEEATARASATASGSRDGGSSSGSSVLVIADQDAPRSRSRRRRRRVLPPSSSSSEDSGSRPSTSKLRKQQPSGSPHSLQAEGGGSSSAGEGPAPQAHRRTPPPTAHPVTTTPSPIAPTSTAVEEEAGGAGLSSGASLDGSAAQEDVWEVASACTSPDDILQEEGVQQEPEQEVAEVAAVEEPAQLGEPEQLAEVAQVVQEEERGQLEQSMEEEEMGEEADPAPPQQPHPQQAPDAGGTVPTQAMFQAILDGIGQLRQQQSRAEGCQAWFREVLLLLQDVMGHLTGAVGALVGAVDRLQGCPRRRHLRRLRAAASTAQAQEAIMRATIATLLARLGPHRPQP